MSGFRLFSLLFLTVLCASHAFAASRSEQLCIDLLTRAEARLERMQRLRLSSDQTHALPIANIELEQVISPEFASARVAEAIQLLEDSPFARHRYRRTELSTSLLFENDPFFSRIRREIKKIRARNEYFERIEDLYPTYLIHPVTPRELAQHPARTLHRRAMGPALLHRAFNEALIEMKALGVRVVLDSGINRISTAGAWFSSDTREIRIGPRTPWKAFRHEVSHARLNAALGQEFTELLDTWIKQVELRRDQNEGRAAVLEVIEPQLLARMEEMQVNLEDVELLLQNQIPGGAFDESLATFAEIRELNRDWPRLRDQLCAALFVACRDRSHSAQSQRARLEAQFATTRIIRGQTVLSPEQSVALEMPLLRAQRVLLNHYNTDRYRAQHQVYGILDIPRRERTETQLQSLRRSLLRLEILEIRMEQMGFPVDPETGQVQNRERFEAHPNL